MSCGIERQIIKKWFGRENRSCSVCRLGRKCVNLSGQRAVIVSCVLPEARVGQGGPHPQPHNDGAAGPTSQHHSWWNDTAWTVCTTTVIQSCSTNCEPTFLFSFNLLNPYRRIHFRKIVQCTTTQWRTVVIHVARVDSNKFENPADSRTVRADSICQNLILNQVDLQRPLIATVVCTL